MQRRFTIIICLMSSKQQIRNIRVNGQKMVSRKSKSRWKRYIATAAVVCLLVPAVGWVLLRVSPKAYQPLTAANPEEVSPYLTHQLGPDFFNQVQFNEPFDLVIDQTGLNDILSRGVWPQQVGGVFVGTPAAMFEAGTLHLMSRIGYYGLSSVVTVTARPVMDERGRLNLNIQAVRLGLIPVTSLAARIAQKAVDENAAEFRDWPDAEATITAIIANEPFEASFTFDKQRIRLQQVTLEPGRLRLRLAPENKAVYKY